MWCIVRYINLPPTLCRSKQTLRLLFVVLPQQYFYLSCETAIQIDEVQQHDIFCTSITLQGWATWVKSQQTITFPDISSPHSDRWWILPDKAFIIGGNRECTKISSLFFSPPSSASLSKSRWTQLQSGMGSTRGQEEKSVETLQDIHSIRKHILITGQPLWCNGQKGRGNGNNCSLPAQIWSHYNGRGCYGNWYDCMLLKISIPFIIYLGVQFTEAQWSKMHRATSQICQAMSPPPPKQKIHLEDAGKNVKIWEIHFRFRQFNQLNCASNFGSRIKPVLHFSVYLYWSLFNKQGCIREQFTCQA